jgi:hypothetical protein
VITEFLIWVLAEFVRLVFSVLPSLPSPAPLLGGVNSGIGQVVSAAGALSFWVPFGQVSAAVAVVLAVVLVVFGIKLVRIVASFLTGGGGSAA